MPPLTFESAARSHVGCVRKLNEDRVLSRPDVGLWAVADGMGGHQAGDLASGMLVDTLAAIELLGSGYAFLEDVQESVQRVNRTLVAHARLSRPGTVIGSTLVVLLAYEGHFACLWAGDSRAYRLRGGRMEQITRDHSMVQELIDSGALQRADAPGYGRSNVITRAVGVNDRLALDVASGPIERGDLFLLCSDGLTGMMSDHEIALALARDGIGAVDPLLVTTLERRAKDNVSMVIVSASDSPDKTADPPVRGFG
ncbi:PP2C family protein-serine/threonine phosphatase [Sphingomonas bacterium]|uniref:PP2C family protein-serine/threonine phosphatase n=1 Tax=Sphingomonas bacterium TaxID=1895847 RepID=UPI00157730B2|nr:protein phosphatase 2C domain-containing protein [Sphingomonas bacterium]